jgi:hypothetical protein
MPEWFIYLAAAAMAAFLVWIFLSESLRTKRDVVPLAEAMSALELRDELRKLAAHGGTLIFEEGECPLPEEVVYRARQDGFLGYGHRSDAPSDTTECAWLTDDGWTFIGREPPRGRTLATGTPLGNERLQLRHN